MYRIDRSFEPLPSRKKPICRSENEYTHDNGHGIVCSDIGLSRVRLLEKIYDALISSASTFCTGGNNRRTTQNVTHATAMMPMGMYQRPSVNGPGTSLSRPEVIRRKMGAAYEVYSPITADLFPCQRLIIAIEVVTLSHPAREFSAVSEKPSTPHIPEQTITSHTALTGVCVCLFIFFQKREPGSAPSRANANTTRDASTP